MGLYSSDSDIIFIPISCAASKASYTVSAIRPTSIRERTLSVEQDAIHDRRLPEEFLLKVLEATAMIPVGHQNRVSGVVVVG